MPAQPKKYFIQTFGCQSNKSDSERLAGDYTARGYLETLDWRQADEIIINTCSVRQRAEDRVKGLLINIQNHFDHPLPKGRGASAQRGFKPKIILTGCMTHHGAKKLYQLLPQVDEILPISEVGFNQSVLRKDKIHAWVPISTGCNSFCTFCIVPYSRGREVSRPLTEILNEIKKLADSGYSQITLLGQNVNSWGLEKAGIGYRKLLMSRDGFSLKDIPSNESQYFHPQKTPPFVNLLQKISLIPQITQISFITSNPWDFWDELIDEIAANPKIDRFIHLPIQSGSDRILKLMNRGYTSQDYLDLITKIKTKIPDAVFGTDIIVGFPGETKTDFQATVNLIKKANWKVAFVAQYSPRPGTAAYRLYQDDIPAKEKKHRWEILDNLINKQNLHVRPEIK